MKQVYFFVLAILFLIFSQGTVAQQMHTTNKTVTRDTKKSENIIAKEKKTDSTVKQQQLKQTPDNTRKIIAGKEQEGEDETRESLAELYRQKWFKMMQQPHADYFKIKKAFDNYLKKHPFSDGVRETGEEWLKQKIYYLNNKGIVQDEPRFDYRHINKINKLFPTPPGVTDVMAGDWHMIGPSNQTVVQGTSGAAATSGGFSRLVRYDPTNTSKIFISFMTGGLWVSTDAGVSWHLSDANFPDNNYEDLDVCQANTNIVYAISKDAVIKSTDGGQSWTTTTLNKTNYTTGRGYDLAVSPSNANIVVARWGTILYRTTDGGVTWSQILASLNAPGIDGYGPITSEILDFSNNTASNGFLADWVSGSSSVKIYKTTNDGAAYSLINTITIPSDIPSQNITAVKVATATSDPNALFVFVVSGSAYVQLYKIDMANGNALTLLRKNMVNGNFGGGDIVMDITNSNRIAYGGYLGDYTFNNVTYSTNNGQSFSHSTDMHSDLRSLCYVNGKVLVGTDGEALQSIDNGATFNNISSTISNVELWGFGSSFKSDMLAAGCNHGPLTIQTFVGNGGWFNWGGADQQNTDINPLDSTHVISRGYDAYILTRTGPQAFASASGEVDAGREDWFNNLSYHPNVYGTIISHTAGNFPKPEQGTPTGQHLTWRNSLIRSTNNGLNITSTVHTFSDRLMREKICMLDTARIYAIVSPTNNTLWKTTDGGVNWTDITPSTTVTGTGVRNMSDVAVSDANPNEIWVSYSGVQNTCQVLHSTDGGVTYTNLTTAVLTSSPITRIVFQRGTNGGLYVGSKAGIFYRNNSMSDWQMLGNGLPMTDIRNLFINYWKGKLLVGTSRGAWDHDLYEHSATKAQISVDKRISPCSQPVKFRDYSVVKSGAGVSYSWSFPGGTPSSSTLENPTVTYANQGTYNVSLTVTDQYGSNTQTLNNFIVISGCINDCSNPVDIPHAGWHLVYADSQESSGEDGSATNAFDDNPGTFWHTQYTPSSTPYPHEIQIDLGATYRVSKFKYLPRQSGTNGIIANYEVYVSNSTTSWGTAVATGTFVNDATEKIVSFTATDGRYIRFRALSEVNGNAWASAAEINVTGCIAPPPATCPSPQDISTTAWRLVSADSQQSGNPATNAFDGNTSTFWHTQYSPTSAPYPHEIQIDMNASYAISKIKYLPRQDGSQNGRVANYEIYISSSTSSWGTAVATGTMANDATEKVISFTETTGRYIRFRALSEVNGNPWTSAAEIKVVGCATQTCPSANDNLVNDAFSSAVQIPLNTDMFGKVSPSGDNDFYKFTITTGGTITVTLGTLPGDYDIYLYNSAQTQVGKSENSGTSSETINYTATAGTYYLKILGYNGANSASTCYTLKVATGTASLVNTGNIPGSSVTSDKKTIEVSPNPAKDVLNIKLAGYDDNIVAQVFDMFGSMVLQKKLEATKTPMDISKLSNGVYLVKFFDNDKQVYAIKIIKE